MSENKQNQTEQTSEINQNSQTDQNGAANVGPVEDSGLKTANERTVQLENELKLKDAELSTLKTRVTQLEQEVLEAQKFKAQHLKEAEEVEVLKEKSEDTLTKAKGIIFDKVKIIKNQELQIEALNQQIGSLKDVVAITKDLLEIRNLEIKQLETKIQCIEDKFGAERQRYDLMHKKLESMIRYNGELKREYETQLCLFSALRERYSERELARGVLEQARTDAGPSTSTSDPSTSTSEASTNQVNGDVTENGEQTGDK